MVEKVTEMMVKVDLQCSRCLQKIKKILCKFPQIRNHKYDYEKNAVFITVVCCSPEKIRDKIICKGGNTVLGVEILPEKKPPEPPKEEKKPDKPKEQPKEQEKKPEKPKEQPKEQEKKPEKPKEPEKPEKPKEPENKPEKPKEPEKKPEKPKETKDPEKPPAAKPTPVPTPAPAPAPAPPTKPPAPAPALPPPNVPQPVPGYPPMSMYPMVGVCWCPCYEGCGGGPCYCQRQGRPVMCSDGCGRPAYECQGGSRPYCVSRCDYFNEENATGCIVM